MTLVYLYAVGPALTAGWLAANDLPGIAGSPVRAVCERQLTAAVSDVPADQFDQEPLDRNVVDPEWLAPHAAAHHEVNAALLDGVGTILPLAFGTIFRSEEGVLGALRDRAAELEIALTALAGRVEWVCTLDRDRRAAGEHLQRMRETESGGQRSESPGKAYLIKRKAEVASVDDLRTLDHEARSQFRAVLDGLSGEVTEEPIIEGGPAARCTVLLPRNDGPSLLAALERFEDSWAERGYAPRADGPWPPYRYSARVGTLRGA